MSDPTSATTVPADDNTARAREYLSELIANASGVRKAQLQRELRRVEEEGAA